MSSVEASCDQTTLRAETYDGVSIMSNARVRDTLDEYLDARYMGRIEAAFRLMGLFHNGVLGACAAHCDTIEFQRRGPPHAHMLLFLN